jgi:hypothetical protein
MGHLSRHTPSHSLDTNCFCRYLQFSDEALRPYRLLSLSHVLRHDSLCVGASSPRDPSVLIERSNEATPDIPKTTQKAHSQRGFFDS